MLTDYVERGEVPGLVSLVSRRGETRVEVIGSMAVDGPPMQRGTIFRIASVTKPIVAAAAMILVEEGTLRLDEPVDRLLPELADRRVLRRIDSPLDDTVPANRPITLRDVLTFRLGYGMILAMPDSLPIQALEREIGLTPGPPQPDTAPRPDEGSVTWRGCRSRAIRKPTSNTYNYPPPFDILLSCAGLLPCSHLTHALPRSPRLSAPLPLQHHRNAMDDDVEGNFPPVGRSRTLCPPRWQGLRSVRPKKLAA